MAVTVTHPFVSAIADGADATVVRPSNWNATHSISGTLDVANGGTGVTTSTGTGSTVLSALPTFAGAIVSVTDNTNAALRITQLGTGNALLVEDSTNPDASPFVIDANGIVVIGHTAAIPAYGFNNQFEVIGTNGYQLNAAFRADAFAPIFTIAHSRNATIGSHTVAQSGDEAGIIAFAGSDGTQFIRTAQISSSVDGTPGTNDMPGRLVFSTTADGASSPTERMRINSSGTVSLASTTEQTGTTGAMTVAGGVYIAKKLTAIGGISGGTF